MATVSYDVCDRCGAEIKRRSRNRVTVYRFKWVFLGITSESRRELCNECTEQMETFLYKKGSVVTCQTES